MKITWDRDAGKEIFTDVNGVERTIDVTCFVRNELNGRRLLSEKPCYTEDEDGKTGGEGNSKPYMPRPFPKGEWSVVAINDVPPENDYEAPEFISTDAHQEVEVWSVIDGHYGEKTGETVEDFGYGQHNSTSNTTLGCGRILQSEDRALLSATIRAAWGAGDIVKLIVA